MKRRKQEFYEAVSEHPIIAAVKDEKGLQKCIRLQEIGVVFVLYGGISNIGDIVKRLKEAGKTVIVHMDLIMGLSAKEEAVVFIAKYTQADGIISTRMDQIRRAGELSLFTVYRIFAIDSRVMDHVTMNRAMSEYVDFVEILPGLMPKIIRMMQKKLTVPLITGGLITEKADVIAALDAGAVAISTTNEDVWMM